MPPPLLAWNSQHTLHNGRMNENAARLEAVVHHLQSEGLWERCQVLSGAEDYDEEAIAKLGIHSARYGLAITVSTIQNHASMC